MAAALTWQQVFANAPAPYGLTAVPPSTGLAMRDVPAPVRTYEVHVQGNRVGNTSIAGLMFLAQSSLQSGQGFINAIDYTTGMFEVGGQIGVPGTGQRVMINDPEGKFGRLWTPDPRFSIDENNPTVRSETGYPMCLPREAPATVNADGAVGDRLCPQANRPTDQTSPSGFAMVFQFPAVAGVVAGGPDPRLMAPFEVGDYVTYSGILVNDPTPATTTYIAAYQVIANVGLFTSPATVWRTSPPTSCSSVRAARRWPGWRRSRSARASRVSPPIPPATSSSTASTWMPAPAPLRPGLGARSASIRGRPSGWCWAAGASGRPAPQSAPRPTRPVSRRPPAPSCRRGARCGP